MENKVLLETVRVLLVKGRAPPSFLTLIMENIAYRLLARQLDNFYKICSPERILEEDDRQ